MFHVVDCPVGLGDFVALIDDVRDLPAQKSSLSLTAARFLACAVLRKGAGDALLEVLPCFASRVQKSKWLPVWLNTSGEVSSSEVTPSASTSSVQENAWSGTADAATTDSTTLSLQDP